MASGDAPKDTHDDNDQESDEASSDDNENEVYYVGSLLIFLQISGCVVVVF